MKPLTCERCIYQDERIEEQPCCGCVNNINFESDGQNEETEGEG